MFEGHDPYLVALSVAIAILGGYTGFGLTARIRGTPDASHRLLLAGAAFFLAIGIWTMHFVGMLAAPLPAGTVYLVLPTVISFLICALVVGISLFFVSVGEPSMPRVVSSAVLLGVGIASMHYVGMHGLSGDFAMTHDPAMVVLSVADRDRHRLWRPAGVPRPPGRRSAGAERGGVRHRGAGHALHRDGGHASGSAVGRIAPPRRGAGGIVADAFAGRDAALLRDRGGLPAVRWCPTPARRSRAGGRRRCHGSGRSHRQVGGSLNRHQRGPDQSAAAADPARRHWPAAPRRARATVAGRRRRRHPFHRHRRYQERPGRRPLHQGA